MLKTKKSFFERVTGSTSIEPESRNNERPMSVFSEEEEAQMIMNAEPKRNMYVEEESFSSDAEGQLTIDVYQTDNEIVIKSTIAGVKPEGFG